MSIFPLEEHIFFALLIPDMSYEEKQLLDDALIRTYARKGITHDNASLSDPNNPNVYRQMPVLGDLYDVLREESDTKRLSNKNGICVWWSSICPQAG